MVYSRFLCIFSLIFSVLLSACSKPDNAQSSPEAEDAVYKAENVRIGYQRSSTLMTLLKESGELEKNWLKKMSKSAGTNLPVVNRR